MAERKIRNMEEFSAASGISRPTVSKYFNAPDSVRASTRAKIEAALEQFDFRPNFYAMNQNRRLTRSLGIVVPYLSDPFFSEIARVVENLAIQGGYRPILLSSQGSRQQELDNLENLRLIRPAGVLLAPLGRSSDRAAVEEFCNGVPTVLFDANLEDVGLAFVGSNNQQSIALIVEYLCRTGEPPAFFEMLSPPNPNALKRRSAYIASMERLGHAPNLLQAEGEGWDFEEIGFREGGRMIGARSLPSNTILCSNDRLAIGMLSAAYERGLRVGVGAGSALRIAGHDDHPFSRYTCPTLTTVSQSYDAIAARAVATLFGIIESGERPATRETTLYDGKLVMRGSA